MRRGSVKLVCIAEEEGLLDKVVSRIERALPVLWIDGPYYGRRSEKWRTYVLVDGDALDAEEERR